MASFSLPSNPKFETYNCKFYEFKPPGFELKVFAQVLKESIPSLDDMVYLKNDYELAHELSSSSALKAIEMVRSESGFIIYTIKK